MKEVLLFKIDENFYAIEVSNIREVINLEKEINKIPNSSKNVLGLLLHRNQALPILDLKYILSKNKNEIEKKKIIILDIIENDAGFLIDQVLQVTKVENKDLMELPNGLGHSNEFMFKFNEKLCHLLSKDRLLSYLSDNEDDINQLDIITT